eukprot:CAMPEP_0178417776 /NCGR_PEP_ID=MMETSP0689_2-20121128/24744_1 /TAXON_ID=160604 /ORGANISM="Amphidinium massartii, Strain CS-259" /LENGTH=371 /DNA_ID=CAMNT_0020039143 /DNA_START=197 /DNA_END=1308 /DNA_ORIENTATION=-
MPHARAALTTFFEAPIHEPSHSAEDFLFGGVSRKRPTMLRRPLAQSAQEAYENHLEAMMLPQATSSSSSRGKQIAKFTPQISMMGLLRAPPGRSDEAEEEEDDEPEKGWCKYVPRGLTFFATVDAVGALILAATRNNICDFPLRHWIVGGMLLGFPASYLVHRVAAAKPAYSIYRFTALQLRGGGDPDEMLIDGLALFRLGNLPIESPMTQQPDGNSGGKSFLVTLDSAEVIASYQVISSNGDVAKDPVAWKLEGSNDGLHWEPVDAAEEPDFPRARRQASALLEDLLHLENDNSFRKAFWLEVGMTAAAFGWLMAGTSWVSASSEACIDSAPLLWVPSFVNIVFSWSALGTMTVGLIVSAVAMVAIGAKA